MVQLLNTVEHWHPVVWNGMKVCCTKNCHDFASVKWNHFNLPMEGKDVVYGCWINEDIYVYIYYIVIFLHRLRGCCYLGTISIFCYIKDCGSISVPCSAVKSLQLCCILFMKCTDETVWLCKYNHCHRGGIVI